MRGEVTMGLIACEACKAEVSSEATACPKCGHPTTKGKEAEKPSDTFALLMLLTPLGGVVLIETLIPGMRLIENPTNTLRMIEFVVVITCAVLGALDTAALRKGAIGIKPKNSPAAWAAFLALVWFVAYPAYFIGRGKTGARSFAVPAILLCLIFLGLVAFYESSLDDAMSEWQRKIGAIGN